MQTSNWQEIENIFFEAVSLPAEERENFIKIKSGNNAELYSKVSVLIDNDSRTDIFLDEPLFTLGAQILALDNETILKQTEFAGYKLQKLLGRGGMGLVLLAEDVKLRRLVALKVLPVELTENPENILRFQNEARAASNVAHQNVAHIYEFGEFEGRYFLAMEYVRGHSLREMIRENPLAPKTAFDIAVQIAAALAAAHKNGIIHRDIKPENIIVTDDGLVKVLDFGLAKSIDFDKFNDADESSSLKTEKGLIMGTTAYMSPEQVRGKEVNETTDIWSLGVCLYEMLKGKRPFEGETRSDTIAAILKNEPAPLTLYNSDISAFLDSIILKTLQKERENRYQNAQELATDLRELKKKAFLENGSLKIAYSEEPKAFESSLFADLVKKYKLQIIFSLLFLFAAAVAAGFMLSGSVADDRPPASAPINSVAVLPFINESGNAEQEYLSDGLTEALIHRLSQLENLQVKARSSVFQFKGKPYVPQAIGSDLAVHALVIGRINERGENLTLNLELVDVRTGNQLWGEQYNYRKSDLVSLQNTLTLDVSEKIKNKLSGAERKELAKTHTQNPEAFQLYLKGRFHWNKRTGRDLQKSIEFYEQAVAADPNFAAAYAGLANSYVLLSGYAASSPHDSFPKAKEAAQKALKIDETLAEAHTALFYVLFNYDWNFEDSEKEIKRAIELNPNYATAYHWYGNANLLAMGRFDESIQAMEKARDLDPLSLIINADLATSYLYAEQFDKAIELYKKTIELDENFYYSRIYLGRTYSLKGDHDAAIVELKKAEALYDDPQVQMLLARTYISMGKPQEARKILNTLKEKSKKGYVSPYYIAEIHAGLGEKDEAFQWLEKALEMREGPMVYLKVEPFFRELHSDPRFDKIMARVGLK